MKTEDITVSELLKKKADYNPRKINDKDMESLKRSLTSFGCVEPIVLNKRTDRIVGGHQRVQAASDIGMKTMPVFHVDLDESEEKALNVALNRISGVWDDDKLTELMASLDEQGFDLAETGFDSSELEDILNGWNAELAPLQGIEEDDGEMTARIGVLCSELDKADVVSTIEKAISESGIEKVRITGA